MCAFGNRKTQLTYTRSGASREQRTGGFRSGVDLDVGDSGAAYMLMTGFICR